MKDPRERVEVGGFIAACSIDEDGVEDHSSYRLGPTVKRRHDDELTQGDCRPWSDVVAFALAILAADSQWREQNAPTLAELIEKFPAVMPACVRQERSVDGFYAEYLTPGVPPGYACARFASRVDALEWLAAELAKEGK